MKKFLALAMATMISGSALADIAVVVNVDNNTLVSERTLKNIFLGRDTTYPDGSQAAPVFNKEKQSDFASKVLRKSASQIDAYWSRLAFTGQATMPAQLADDSAVLKAVAASKNSIGFVDLEAAKQHQGVKIVKVFN